MNSNRSVKVLAAPGDPFEKKLTQWLRESSMQVTMAEKEDAKGIGLVVFSPHLRTIPERIFPSGTFLVFRRDCAPAAALAASGRYPPLDYGFSLRDTLTFSSIGDKQAVVALQRPVQTMSGELLEPLEIPVRLTAPADQDLLLCAAAVALLCGEAEHLTVFP